MKLFSSSTSLTHVLLLTRLAATSVIPDGKVLRTPSGNRFVSRTNSAWPYGVIGDSWGSGVSYNKTVLFDDNLDSCLRTWESHGPQMDADTSWTGSFSSGLRDAACSGSQLVDLAKGAYQMGKVGNPDVVVMTSGGNNAGFASVAENCIYHPSPTTNYGPAYGDDSARTGNCAVAIDAAKNSIANTLGQDLINTINDILDDVNVKSNPNFLLYLTGYAQFFGTDYDAWCNNQYFNIPGISSTAYLSVKLRTDINALVSSVNNLYKNTITENFAKQARFIDIDSGFSGHRFCEPGMTKADQYVKDTKDTNVWLWNLNFFVSYADDADDTAYQNGNMTQARAQLLLGTDTDVTAWSGSGGPGGNDPSNGWRLRPFHPKYSGYTSIKNSILAQLKTDGYPKAEAAATTTARSLPAPTSSVAAAVCSAGFYGTDTSCGGKCNGSGSKCQCIEAGYESFNNACTCTC